MKYNLAIAEDDVLILELLIGFLRSSEKFEQIFAFNNGGSFLNQVESIQDSINVILLDYRLGDTTAESVLSSLESKKIKVPVIILTSFYNMNMIGYMVKNGVAAYLPKNIQPKELIAIIEEVIEKGHYFAKDQFAYFRRSLPEDGIGKAEKSNEITKREIEIIYLLANQLTAKEIADKLCLSPKTVEGYKNNLFIKTGTRNVVGLVLFAVQNQLIEASAIDLNAML